MARGEVSSSLTEAILSLDSQELSEVPVRFRGHENVMGNLNAGMPSGGRLGGGGAAFFREEKGFTRGEGFLADELPA